MVQQNYTPDRPTIYRFKLDRILGKGGAGTVYRGLDSQSGNIVALKLFRDQFFRTRLHLHDFSRNANKFKKFSHVNLAQIFEFIEGKEGICLILEYVDGPSLRWYLENRPWNLQERLVITAQICNGLQYLHDKGFLHHDLKPANILLTRKGVVKLVDYSLGGSNLLSWLDSSWVEHVTPMYVAPELIRNEKATPQTDMYALGITLYQMYTERMPFPVDNLQTLYQCHLRLVPDHPTIVNNKCPQVLGDIIMRMLDKKPENRFENCDQLRIILADIGRRRI